VALRPQRVGNDVVDLTDPVIARHHDRGRFVARVCSDDERARVRSARDLWTLFASKEAAYKVLVKLGASPGFGHRSIRVAQDLATATWNDVRVALAVTGDAEHVHALAWTGGPPPTGRVVRSGGGPDDEREDEGARARAVLCDLVATATGCAPSDLRVVRDPAPGAWDGYGPPRVERGGALVAVDVSLSHDGRFVAAAATRP
jgi:phosphopantetheinyl transferase (holo-ACP synthase)